jgi:para-nitrobenzyl esterase
MMTCTLGFGFRGGLGTNLADLCAWANPLGMWRSRRNVRATRMSSPFVAFALACILGLILPSAVEASPRNDGLTKIVQTDRGPVRGIIAEQMDQYLGVPFAAPPIGPLRWRPPVAHALWDKVRDVTAYGPACAQNDTSFPDFATASEHEDCLFLNVFTPAKVKSAKPLPVIVWIPGGGLFMGGTNGYDPSALVDHGQVILVSVGYRVSIFGFFSHPAINVESHEAGNYGIMDQQFALGWIKRNIAQFGGDPGNVTLAGESAGGYSIWAHMVSPGSKDLFQKAIVESGSSLPVVPMPTLEQREAVGRNLAAAAGCPDQTAECLRSLSVKQLLAANALPAGTWGGGRFQIGLVDDGKTIPGPIRNLFEAGRFSHVPVINGTNRNEFNWFQAMKELVSGKVISAADFAGAVAAAFGPDEAPKILALYPLSQFPAPGSALAAVIGDSSFICAGNRRINQILLRYDPDVYGYEFNVPDSPIAWRPVSFPYRAAHTVEMQYLFPRYRGDAGTPHDLNKDQKLLAERMVRYWTTFAKTGAPNDPKSVDPHWAPYRSADDNFLSLEAPLPIARSMFGQSHNCDFWDQHQ